MQKEPIKIAFDLQKHPGLGFDILPLEELSKRQDLDHNPQHLHRVNFYILLIITAGQGKHTIDFKTYPYRTGSVFTIRKNQVHRFHPGSAKGYIILFTEEFVNSYLAPSSAMEISELYNELLFLQQTNLNENELQAYLTIVELIQAEFKGPLDSHTPGILRNLLQVLMHKLHRQRKVAEQFKKDQKYIQQFLTLQSLVEQQCQTSRAVRHYAEQLNVTTRTLNNITHHIAGKSCKTFIDEILILQIKRQLINSTRSVKEIAYQSGFEEPSNLFKFFKRYTGQTPTAFRSAHAIN